ncbi:MAG: hypothetical protein WD448_11640 [Woeseia sp.]
MAKLRTWALLIFGALAVAYIAVFSPTVTSQADPPPGVESVGSTSGYMPVALERSFKDEEGTEPPRSGK